ncbi:sugar phosphate isomerase/epimerase family protein [Haloarchaeobius sp. TZWSO28]|uniref:sugar phosphate isomerase/epimerase family protein n=1 Tax=Haloarchaeobius sp. TZWSO28 TaxID=3446119 RepID=UPI003EBE639E
MDIGVLTAPFGDRSLEETLTYLSDLDVDTVELGCGGFPGGPHLDREKHLDNPAAQSKLHALLDEHDISVSALATHNNPLHPDEETAATADRELREAIELAAQLDVNTVTCFSGLPAGGPNDEVPNWVTAPWPTVHADAHDYQWEVATEYWSRLAAVADEHAVDLAIEMHPNMLVYEPTGMMKLREATNERVGANFDPSHLYWQDIDVTKAIRFLGEKDAIHHFHAKDTKVYSENAEVKGVLDTTDYTEEIDRSWLFRSVGYGHGEEHWKDVVSTLRMVGYDGALSIEHEDSLTSSVEGLEKAVELLKRTVFETEPWEDAFWV